MAEQGPKVKCPLCDGRGEWLRFEIIEMLGTPELRKRFDARMAEILHDAELAGVAGPAVRNFEKEVHVWNPALPMWRRSNKE
jgi:hypothetical protein